MRLCSFSFGLNFRATENAMLLSMSTIALHCYGGRLGIAKRPVAKTNARQGFISGFIGFANFANFHQALVTLTLNTASAVAKHREVSRETSIGHKPNGAISEKMYDLATSCVFVAPGVPFCCSPALWPAAQTITHAGFDCGALHHQTQEESQEEEEAYQGVSACVLALAPRFLRCHPPLLTKTPAPQGPSQHPQQQ